jgi:hypothetical protein
MRRVRVAKQTTVARVVLVVRLQRFRSVVTIAGAPGLCFGSGGTDAELRRCTTFLNRSASMLCRVRAITATTAALIFLTAPSLAQDWPSRSFAQCAPLE